MASTLSKIDKYTKKQRSINNNQEKLQKQRDTSDSTYIKCWLYKNHTSYSQRNKNTVLRILQGTKKGIEKKNSKTQKNFYERKIYL